MDRELKRWQLKQMILPVTVVRCKNTVERMKLEIGTVVRSDKKKGIEKIL